MCCITMKISCICLENEQKKSARQGFKVCFTWTIQKYHYLLKYQYKATSVNPIDVVFMFCWSNICSVLNMFANIWKRLLYKDDVLNRTFVEMIVTYIGPVSKFKCLHAWKENESSIEFEWQRKAYLMKWVVVIRVNISAGDRLHIRSTAHH